MLTSIEAWAVKRVLCRMPIDLDKLRLSDNVYFICSDLQNMDPNERVKAVEARLPHEDVKAILKIDPNKEAPAETQIHGQWQIIHASELNFLPKAKWLIEPFIVERGLTVLFGASGTYKSFAALDYALQVAENHTAIYVIYEGLLGYRQRIAAWCDHHRKSVPNLYMVVGNLAVMDVQELKTFIETARSLQPALVVLDTVARAMTGSDENSTRDMGLFVQACEELKRQLETAVLVVHHTSKAGIQERGSGALRGAADIMIRQALEDDVITVECEKSKDAEPFPTQHKQALPIMVNIDGEMFSVPVLVNAAQVIATGERLTKHQLKVLEALAMELFVEGATPGELIDQLPDVPRPSLNRVLSTLMKLGLISQSSKREPYRLTEAGKNRLNRLYHLYQAPVEVEKDAE